MPTHQFSADTLQAFTQQIFMAVGTPEHIAKNVAEILIGANLTGHDSHGVLRIPTYLRLIEADILKPTNEPKIIKETDNTLVFDGQFGFGHHMARLGMAAGIEKAKQANTCSVAFRNSTHIGRLGEYAEQAAAAGCIGIITCGTGGGSGRAAVVPFGGIKGAMSTNPIAVGVPTGTETPFVLDFATSVVAEGKLQVARSKNTDVTENILLNQAGQPTTNPLDFYDGGYLMPVGGHKGYALALMTCLLGGLGGGFDIADGKMRGEFMHIINIDAFTPLDTYQQGVQALFDHMRAIPPADGVDSVLIPGEPEQKSRASRMTDGIELPQSIYEQLQTSGAPFGVAL